MEITFFGAWLSSFENESWIVVSQEKINVEFSAILVGLQLGLKVKVRIFT